MAYIFLTPDSTGCLKIAQNDADKQAIMGHHPASSYVQQTISDVDVDNLRLGTHHIKIENGQVIIEQKIENPTFTEEMFLKNYILHTKKAISLFLNNFRNNSNSW